MKILLLTVTAGYGHHATAKALADLFEQRGAETKIVDVYEYISKVVRTAISQGYLLSSKYTPELYRLFYTKTSKNREKLNKMNIVKIVNTLGAFKFEHFVDNFEPDAIVCTHVLAAHLISEMKNRHMVDAPCIGVVTDYCIHPYWEDVVNMEALVTASELITHTAVKRGIPEEIILPEYTVSISGIFPKRTPVRSWNWTRNGARCWSWAAAWAMATAASWCARSPSWDWTARSLPSAATTSAPITA